MNSKCPMKMCNIVLTSVAVEEEMHAGRISRKSERNMWGCHAKTWTKKNETRRIKPEGLINLTRKLFKITLKMLGKYLVRIALLEQIFSRFDRMKEVKSKANDVW